MCSTAHINPNNTTIYKTINWKQHRCHQKDCSEKILKIPGNVLNNHNTQHSFYYNRVPLFVLFGEFTEIFAVSNCY